nr:hypothetical protein Iba_chr12aCG22450 [Ipomoea batatas]GMD67332.1 hypothetical protein Iba_chr12cCG23570 [Ipomoea batatas]GMD71361.1 hypothetical protein Iba_chr12eCG15220 [Ipomoea batatas]GMD73825.1 hypothetical protein Iba_chr12fCG22170 [Ipomoea batatas]
METNTRRLIWIIFVTEQLQLINTALMYRLVWTNYGPRPRTHVKIISIIHSIAYRPISNTFLSTFKLLKQPKIPRNYYARSSGTECHFRLERLKP